MDGGREGRKKGEKEDTEGEKGGTEGEKEKGRGKVREEEGSGRKTQLCDSVQVPLHFIAEELGNKVLQKKHAHLPLSPPLLYASSPTITSATSLITLNVPTALTVRTRWKSCRG